jgi:hypothetical protein
MPPIPQSGASSDTILEGVHIACSREIFMQGIKYEVRYLQKTFPAAFVVISDAKILARNYLNNNLQCIHDKDNLKSYCTQVLSELSMVATHFGQPGEVGEDECK